MKKIYQRPEILIEHFQISEQIAAAVGSCEAVVTLIQNGCTSTNNVFLAEALNLGVFSEGCTLDYRAGSSVVGNLEKICYQGPPENSIYRS